MFGNGFSSELSPKFKTKDSKLQQKRILKLGIDTLLAQSDEEDTENNSPTFRKLKSIEEKERPTRD